MCIRAFRQTHIGLTASSVCKRTWDNQLPFDSLPAAVLMITSPDFFYRPDAFLSPKLSQITEWGSKHWVKLKTLCETHCTEWDSALSETHCTAPPWEITHWTDTFLVPPPTADGCDHQSACTPTQQPIFHGLLIMPILKWWMIRHLCDPYGQSEGLTSCRSTKQNQTLTATVCCFHLTTTM